MDLGLTDRHLGKVDVNVGPDAGQIASAYGKESVRKVIEDPQSRRKLMGLVERLVEVQSMRGKIKQEVEAAAASDSEADPSVETEDLIEEPVA